MLRLCRVALALAGCGALLADAAAPESPRHERLLDQGWTTAADDADVHRYDGFEQHAFAANAWREVTVPHNWDDYGGAHRVVHGNRHGYAWYRRTVDVPASEAGRRVLLYFEGVGSYATVWVNGKPAGQHAGGRTTFTLDVTSLVNFGGTNLLAVRADHPAGIKDLPWVCGGCSTAAGFSEGSQPMGIFRPVHLITTNAARVTPFGVHVWTDASATAETAGVHVRIEIENLESSRELVVETRLLDRVGSPVATRKSAQTAKAGEVATVAEDFSLTNVALWSPGSPTLYTAETLVWEGANLLDRIETTFGIRSVQWPRPAGPPDQPLQINARPFFINGTCEYEHVLGASHAFSAEQIRTRVAQVEAAGFNAFRDAHQPHNLRYQAYWDRDGLLWWPQFAAQIWYDTPEFRANFKTLLREWVRERRNSPSLVLWGLANESKLPEDFARECVALIRELDPTSPEQRLVTTCNSGKGTDWNVPQNWSGTYAGDPDNYANELRAQRLIGEYGAWRSLGLHTEGGFVKAGPLSENRFDALMEQKIRLAESVRERAPGHFHWLLASHDNPGRTINAKLQQGGDGWGELDRIGPVNNKGLFTIWGEPTDAYYLFRANYAPAATDPMVYIVSHTWPDRWDAPGQKSGIVVYSNCDEVELFNDVGHASFGRRVNPGRGSHFQWDDVPISANVLYAEGRVAGKIVARDVIVLNGLPPAEHLSDLDRGADARLPAGAAGWNYLYRVNCGGPEFVDSAAQKWNADRNLQPGQSWGSVSWAAAYPDVPPRFGSQRQSFEPVAGTTDDPLFQSYRYGREQLRYRFTVPPGQYRIELYFAEPWYGAGGGDCSGWRLFDVAVNGETKLRDVDLWREAGFAHAVKKVVEARDEGGILEISFPRVASYQAVISAIAIATLDPEARAPNDREPPAGAAAIGTPSGRRTESTLPGGLTELELGSPQRAADGSLSWSLQLGLGGAHEFKLRYSNPSSATERVELTVHASDGALVGREAVALAPTARAEAGLSSAASFTMNAGDYTVTISAPPKSSTVTGLFAK